MSQQVLSSKSAILALASRGFKTKIILVPQWGKDESVRIRELSEAQVRKVSLIMSGKGPKARTKAAMSHVYPVCVWCIIGEDGERIFSDGDERELRSHAETSSFYLGLQEICGEIFMLSGLDTDEDDEEGTAETETEVEETEEGEVEEDEEDTDPND